jgi:hypothetical protein
MSMSMTMMIWNKKYPSRISVLKGYLTQGVGQLSYYLSFGIEPEFLSV